MGSILAMFSGRDHKCLVSHYEADLDLWPRTGRIGFRVHVSVFAKSPSDSYYFLLHEKYQIESVSYLGISTHISVKTHSKELKSINIRLPRKSTPGEKITLLFTYSGPFPWYPGQKIDWELAPEDYWYPFIPNQQHYTARLRITTPEHTKICASGVPAGENRQDTRYRTNWTVVQPGKDIHIVAGDYYRTSKDGEYPLTIYYPRSLMNQAKAITGHWDKLCGSIFTLFRPLDTESSWIILTNQPEMRQISSKYITCISSGQMDTLKAHGSSQERNQRLLVMLARQVAHRVLKARLRVESPQDAWYLEGLAEYIAWCVAEAQFGTQVKEELLLEARPGALQATTPLEGSCSQFSLSHPQWVAAKAGWVMQMAHALIGDEFFPALKTLLEPDQPIPEPKNFFTALGKEANLDMGSFYRELATTTNNIEAVVENARSFTDASGEWQLVFNLSNRGRLRWPHPMEIVIKLKDGSQKIHHLPIQKEPHHLVTPSQVTDILVNPSLTVLNQGKIRYQL